MTDDPRRVAIAAIVRIDEEGAYANVLLPRLLADSDLEGRDRGFVTELVYGSTRRRRALDHVVDRFLMQTPPPAARAALRIGAHQLIELGTPPHAAVSATVSASPKRFRGLVNAVLRKVSEVASGVEYPSLAIELSYPDWILARLSADIGAESAEAALRSMNTAATVHTRSDGYVQDPSSQLVAAAVPGTTGHRVLDLCAAPGGKSTAIAARGARVVAADRRFSRAGLVAQNRRRLELDDLHIVQADATAPPFASGSFDTVLVDAPCSGLGAFRRRPDARWRVEPDAIDRLAALQVRMLSAAAPLVTRGGALVYSVCTLTSAESAGVAGSVADTLASLGFSALPPPEGAWFPLDNGAHLLLPGDDSDGMAIARWQRA